ncbi:MAG TPA: phosphatase PAP2 family protein [Candidatus Binatia bacterium]|nr:phosphatase PAP2 family protein [Candidatus Binatia bacterium]
MENTSSKRTTTERNLFILCLVFLLVFLLITFFRTSFNSVDVEVNLWIPSIQSGPLTIFAEGVAVIFDTTSLIIMSLAISTVLYLKNYKTHALLFLVAMGGDALLVSVAKILDHVARPANGILFDTSFSYPSGHSAGVIVFCGMLAYFAWWHWRSTRSRALIGAGIVAVAAIVGFDRVYLNVHWLSDVFGGWLLGAFWLSFIVLVFVQLRSYGWLEPGRFSLAINVLFVLAFVVAVFIVLVGLFGISLSFSF